jgi:hypothetical protein
MITKNIKIESSVKKAFELLGFGSPQQTTLLTIGKLLRQP